MNKKSKIKKWFKSKQIEKDKITKWIKSNFINIESWEANNIHIDELIPKIKRCDWVNKSFEVFNFMLKNKYSQSSKFILVMNFDLKVIEDEKISLLDELDFNLILDELDSLTPPCFYFCEINYWNQRLLDLQQIPIVHDNKQNPYNLELYNLYYYVQFESQYNENYRWLEIIQRKK